MDGNNKEKIEALEVLDMFNGRLVGNIKILVKELSGKRKDDTDALLKSVLDSINWEIQVINSTMDVLNENEERIKKDDFNKVISALGMAVAEKDDSKMAECFRETIKVFENIGDAVKKAIAAAS